VLAQGRDPLEPPMTCGPCDFVAGALAVLAQEGWPGDYPSDIRWQSQARDIGYR
jgi:hypothetical protein